MATKRLLLQLRRWTWSPARGISVFVDSKVIDSYGKEDDEEVGCNALSLGPGESTALGHTGSTAIRRREEPDAIAGIALAKEEVWSGSAMKQLVGNKTFRPSRVDNQLVGELMRLLRRGNVGAWEAEDVVRTYGAVLTPYHVCEVLKNCQGNVDMAYAFFKWADLFQGFKHDNYSCNAMLKLLGKNKKYAEIKDVLFGMEDQMIPRTYVTYKTLVNIYVKGGMVEEALEAFHELELCEVRASIEDYNYFMHSLIMLEHPEMVPLIFGSMMKKNKLRPDLQTYNIVINSHAKIGQMTKAYQLFMRMKRWYSPSEYTFAALINGYCKCSQVHRTMPMLEDMLARNLEPTEAIYNMMMDAHYRVGKHEDVWTIFNMMLDRPNLEPDAKSYRILLDSFEDAGKLEDGRGFFKAMVERGRQPSVPGYNTLMSKLMKGRKEQTALDVFTDMESPNVISYNMAMDNLCKFGRFDEAWSIYTKVKGMSIADAFTYNTLISRFGRAGKSDKCLVLLDDMHKFGLRPDEYTYSGLLDAHSRSGKTELALRFLDDMRAAGYSPSASSLDMLAFSLVKAGNSSVAERIAQERREGNFRIVTPKPEGRPKTPKLSV